MQRRLQVLPGRQRRAVPAKPLTSVLAPRRRRVDVAWAIALLWGLVLYQQINATNAYASLDTWLNSHLYFPHYPNPVAYLGIIGLLTLATAGVARGIGALLARRDVEFTRPGSFADKSSRFRVFFLPIAYGLIPIVGADYFARQLSKFFQYSPRVVPAVGHLFGRSGVNSSLYNMRLLADRRIVAIQVAVIALGELGALWAMWAMWRITNRELLAVSRSALAVRVATLGLVAACGAAAAVLYVAMQAAD